VLWVDGDEVLESNAASVIEPALSDREVCAFTLPFAYFCKA